MTAGKLWRWGAVSGRGGRWPGRGVQGGVTGAGQGAEQLLTRPWGWSTRPVPAKPLAKGAKYRTDVGAGRW